MLLVVPYLGGGTTRHVREMAAAWSAQGLRVLLLETQGRLMELDLYEAGSAARRLLFPYDEAFLLEMLRGCGRAVGSSCTIIMCIRCTRPCCSCLRRSACPMR